MIIVKLKGGLGNQMFQYAAGLAAAYRRYQELRIDVIGYDDSRVINSDIPRKYGLYAFNISGSIATPEEVRKARNPYDIFSKAFRFFSQKILKKYYVGYDPDFFRKNHKYIEGYFQSDKDFLNIKEKVAKEFTLKKEFESDIFLTEKHKIDGTKSVSVHIRRGDYVDDLKTNIYHGVCNLDYYKRSIKYLKENFGEINIFVFSDDIAWVKENLAFENLQFVSRPDIKDYEELMLMSKCEHNIIANSSFSWWGAWLNENKNKIIIAPKEWFQKFNINEKHIVPKSWIRL